MGCIFKNSNGTCSLAIDYWGDALPNDSIEGAIKGYCSVSFSMIYPTDSCECYQSDYQCHECGADLNYEECTCDL